MAKLSAQAAISLYEAVGLIYNVHERAAMYLALPALHKTRKD